MKLIALLFLCISLNLFGQDTIVRSFGAIQTDINTLSKMTVAIPLSGATTTLLRKYRMDNDCPPVSNQCNTGSCVSQATAYGLCGILAKRQGLPYLFSPMYMHYSIKQANQPNPPECYALDCRCMGSSLGLAADYLKDKGIPSLNSWEPDQCDFNACKQSPPQRQSAFRLLSTKSLFFPGVQYQQNYKRDIIRYYISQNYPIPIAMSLDNSFVNSSAFNNSKDVWLYFVGQSVGNHAMLIVGYDDDKEAFLVMNSWGTTNWNKVKHDLTNDAKPGYCWISYSIIENYCFEAFVANENISTNSISVSNLLTASNFVKEAENKLSNQKINNVEFFETNKYNPYDNIRLIPMDINKTKGEATVAIYQIEDGEPRFYSAFNIKINESFKFEVGNHKYTFKALYIKPWRRFLGIFNSKDALFYKISIE